jgi:hypothetical protein
MPPPCRDKLFAARFSNVDVLPIRIERQRYAVLLDPRPQHSPAAQIVSSLPMRANVSLLASSTMFIKHPSGASSLVPVVKASIHLYQLTHMLFPLSSLAVHTALPGPAPQPCR